MKKIYRSGVVCLLAFLFLSCLSTQNEVEASQPAKIQQFQEDGSFQDGDFDDESFVSSTHTAKGEEKNSSKASKTESLYKGKGLAIAVLPPELRGGEPWMKQSFQDNLTSLLAGYTDMTVLDRKNEDLIIAQQELSETGLYSEENAVEIGQMTNAQYVVVGSIQKLSASYECNFRVNETATNEIRSASISRHSLADMESGVAVRQIVQELFGGLGIQLTEAEQAALQKKNDVESTSITMLAKGAQAQASEDYIQAVLYYNQVGGTFQQEANASTNQMFSASPENLTVRQRQQYNQVQRAKWEKILTDLRSYLNENLWIGVYHDPLVVKETNISMSSISYKIPSVMKIFPKREAVIVAKKVMEEWYKVKNNPDNKVWTSGVHSSSIGQWRYEIDVGLFDADGNQLATCLSLNSDLRYCFEPNNLFDSNPVNYVVKSQKKYFDDAKETEYMGWSRFLPGAVFDDIEIADMSENTIIPTARILKIEGTSGYSDKLPCKLTLYTLAEWEALMAQQ
ncbi:MAG: hypothetical protein J6R67_08440 [Treponema sp.]|nr:hypothetical protein [Treponema sp.]